MRNMNDDKRFQKDYSLDFKKHDYYVRYAKNMESDLVRNWSSWDFGCVLVRGDVEEVINKLDACKGDTISGDGPEQYIDEDAVIYADGGFIYVDQNSGSFRLGELAPGTNEWVVVDDVNAHCGLSAHLVPEDAGLETAEDVIAYAVEHFGGWGDGECFDAENVRVVYVSDADKNGVRMYVVEDFAENPDRRIR